MSFRNMGYPPLIVGRHYRFLNTNRTWWYVGRLVDLVESVDGARASLMFADGSQTLVPFERCIETDEPLSPRSPTRTHRYRNTLSEDLRENFPHSRMPPPGTLPDGPPGHNQQPQPMPPPGAPYHNPGTMMPPPAPAPVPVAPAGWQGYGGAPNYTGQNALYPGQYATGGAMQAPVHPGYGAPGRAMQAPAHAVYGAPGGSQGHAQVPPGFQNPSATSLSSTTSRSSSEFSLSGYYAASSGNNETEASGDDSVQRASGSGSSSNRHASGSGVRTSDRTGSSQTRK